MKHVSKVDEWLNEQNADHMQADPSSAQMANTVENDVSCVYCDLLDLFHI